MTLHKNIKSVLPDIEESIIKKFGAVALTGKSSIFEHYCEPLDRYYHISVFSNKIRHFATIFNDITYLKKSEKELLKNKNQLQIIFDASPAIMILINENCKITRMNEKGFLFAGKSDNDIYNKCIGDVFNCAYSFMNENGCGNSNECQFCVIRNIVYDTFKNNNKHYKVETIFKTRKDDIINEYKISLTTSLHEFADEKAVLITIDNISELKNAQLALQESKNRLKKIIEFNALPIVVTDSKQNIISFNNKFTEIFGYAIEDIATAEKWWEILYTDADYRKIVTESWNNAVMKSILTGKEMEKQIWDLTCKDGSKKTVEFNFVPLKDINVITMNDITEQKRFEACLKKSEERYRSLFEGSRDGIVIGDLDGRIIDCNKAYSDMLGYSIEELKNMSDYDLTHEKYHEWLKNEIFSNNILIKGYYPVYEK
jgi:PAS domain S-box-containing protein